MPKVSPGRMTRTVVTLALILGTVLLLIRVRQVLIPFILAAVLAYALEAPVAYLARRGFSRGVAIILVYLLVGAISAVLVIGVIPELVRELSNLSVSFPGFIQYAEKLAAALQARYSRTPLPQSVRLVVDESIARLDTVGSQVMSSVASGMLDFFTALPGIILAPFLAFYLSKDLHRIRAWFLSIIPPESRPQTLDLLHDVDKVLAGFVRGEVLVSLIVGGMWGLTMYLLGVPFAVILGIITAIGEIIPYFGPFLALLPALGLALAMSRALGLRVIVAYIVIQQLESIFIVPKVMGANCDLHPLVVIFALLAGEQLGGVGGMIVAVPVAAILKVLLGRLVQHVNRPLTELEPKVITSTQVREPAAKTPRSGKGLSPGPAATVTATAPTPSQDKS